MKESFRRRHLSRVLGAAVSVVGATALAIGLALPAGATVTPPANSTVVGSGSSTTYLMMTALDDVFNTSPTCAMFVASGTTPQPLDFSCIQGSTGDPLSFEASPTNTPENPFGDVTLQEPQIGSSNGIKQLEYGNPSGHSTTVNVANNVNYARSSRASKSSDFAGLNFVAYATDGISWFHYTGVQGPTGTAVPTPSANVTNLTDAQLQGIWNGTINNWSQLGGTNAPITVFSAQAGSGTDSTWASHLGFDPTTGGEPVNCSNPGTVGPTSSSGMGQCVGPAIGLENHASTVSIQSFLNSQQSYLGQNKTLWGTSKVKTTLSSSAAAGATKINVASANNIVGGSKPTKLTIAAAGSGSSSETATVASVSGTTVTLTKALSFPHASGASVTGTTVSAATARLIKSDGVFFYSAGAYLHQCAQSPIVTTKLSAAASAGATSISVTSASGLVPGTPITLAAAGTGSSSESAIVKSISGKVITLYSGLKFPHAAGAKISGTVNECGGITQGTSTPALGNIDGFAPNQTNILEQSFPVFRFLYNVYSNGSNGQVNPVATSPTLNYMSEIGFVCKPQNAKIPDPLTGQTYLTDIQKAILGAGFWPLSANEQATGQISQTPFTDEGNVAHPAHTLVNNTYAPYENDSSTGLLGGYQHASNGDPSGFCQVSSTDGNSP